jgi:Secretion system C-terminal sorting domain
MKSPKISLLLFLLLASTCLYAQRVMWMKPKQPIVCYGKEVEGTSHVPLPPEIQSKLAAARTSDTKSSNFIVTYQGFTPEAQAAFQRAVDIWESILVSPIDIHVTAVWGPLGNGVLGSATAGTFFANFDGAQQINTWYPVSLAEKMAARNLNEPGETDIFAQFNSNNNSWHYGLTGATPVGQYDLVTVVLHELGHGLGFLDSYNISSNVATVGLSGTGIPVIYDLSIENGNAENLFLTTQSNTENLRTQLTSSNLFYNSPSVKAANGNTAAKIFAPASFSSGSSIAHLDESTFPGGTANALMTPQIGTGESNFNPGAIVTGMFADMGWVFTYINHQRLPNIENVNAPLIVKGVITTDVGAIASPTLVYNITGTDVEVPMTSTGLANEYQATIPSTGVATTYNYYIKVKDSQNRTYTKPGKRNTPGQGVAQTYFSFETGEDNKAPIVNHTTPGFILPSDTELIISAVISDNIGIASAVLSYSIDDVDQADINFALQTPPEDSVYQAVIDLGNGFPIGTIIRYKISVTDNSSNSNQKILPETEFFEISVEGLGQPVSVYENDFNEANTDFFGNGFTITTPSGFSDGAIHSEHPYINGDGFEDNQRNLVYQLKFPITLKESDAFILFDEIALVEPGEAGSVFGDDDFWDYVVVEGSKNGGETWVPFANGYDARAHNEWLSRYNSANDGNANSTAVGDASLFKTRIINMLDVFEPGDDVAIRFRLFIDQSARGWGWAIDNLKIQTDITAPKLLHDHIEYITAGKNTPALRALARDAGGISTFTIFYSKNNEVEQSIEAIDLQDNTFVLPTGDLAAGDELQYKFIATDPAGNETTLPDNGYFTIKAVSFSSAVNQYNSNFEVSNEDFVGGFFEVVKPTGFNSTFLKTKSPYANGFGLDSTSNYTSTLLKPIRIAASNTLMRFDEIVLVQGQDATITFGSEAFNDFVIVEGSKDGGLSWLPFLTGYDGNALPAWLTVFNNGGNGTQSLFRSRIIDLTENGNFSTNDEVIIRFRLFADVASNGWGWAIDNLFIQDPVTSLESKFLSSIRVYPNPVEDMVTISSKVRAGEKLSIQVMQQNGQLIINEALSGEDGEVNHQLDFSQLPNGLYILRISIGDTTEIRKVVKLK